MSAGGVAGVDRAEEPGNTEDVPVPEGSPAAPGPLGPARQTRSSGRFNARLDAVARPDMRDDE